MQRCIGPLLKRISSWVFYQNNQSLVLEFYPFHSEKNKAELIS